MRIKSAAAGVAIVLIAIAFTAGRATSPERGITWSEAEAMVCTPLELSHTPAAEFSL